jgi:DNA topoisomerase-3
VCRRPRCPSSSSARRRSASTWRATTGRCKASFAAVAGVYEGKWFDPAWKKNADDPRRAPTACGTARGPRPSPPAAAAGHRQRGAKPSTQGSPLLYDLTTLQREANGRFGFSAKTTLSIAQALYEKHKVLTYPRTDSRHLPEDYLGVVKQTFEMIAARTCRARCASWPCTRARR